MRCVAAIVLACAAVSVASCGSCREQQAEIDRLRAELRRARTLRHIADSYDPFVFGVLAAPTLEGRVCHVAGRLLTVRIDENPDDIDIEAWIECMPFRFAIYDGKTYKGDAVATRFFEEDNVALCRLVIKPDDVVIEVGDRATTNP